MLLLADPVAMAAEFETIQCIEDECMHHVFDRIYVHIGDKRSEDLQVHTFCVDNQLSYTPFCDDFGPMSLGSVFQFCTILEEELELRPNQRIAFSTGSNKQSLTNAVFLMGSYMIMKQNWTSNQLQACFQPLNHRLATFRDVSPGKQNFHLRVEDCWGGLLRAKQMGWVTFEPHGFQLDEYDHYDNPLNADLHEVVPNKFIAFRGPKTIPNGALWRDDLDQQGEFRHRDFSAAYFASILQEFGVQAVIRLNDADYSHDGFTAAGIAVADLRFPDCTSPPVDVVAKFMHICEQLPGPVAVHCKAGLGRTGTLIALYMMKHHAFTAREAIGWLRIVRPGSVIGDQQRFLCDKEAVMRRAGASYRSRPWPGTGSGDSDLPAVQRLISETVDTVDKRMQAIVPAARAAALAAPAGGDSDATASDDNLNVTSPTSNTSPTTQSPTRTAAGSDVTSPSSSTPSVASDAELAAAAGDSERAAAALGAHVMAASNMRATRRLAATTYLRQRLLGAES